MSATSDSAIPQKLYEYSAGRWLYNERERKHDRTSYIKQS